MEQKVEGLDQKLEDLAKRKLKGGMVLYEVPSPSIMVDAARREVVFMAPFPVPVVLNGLGMEGMEYTKARQDFVSKLNVLGVIGPNGVSDKEKK